MLSHRIFGHSNFFRSASHTRQKDMEKSSTLQLNPTEDNSWKLRVADCIGEPNVCYSSCYLLLWTYLYARFLGNSFIWLPWQSDLLYGLTEEKKCHPKEVSPLISIRIEILFSMLHWFCHPWSISSRKNRRTRTTDLSISYRRPINVVWSQERAQGFEETIWTGTSSAWFTIYENSIPRG
jgi:hypothetical protein